MSQRSNESTELLIDSSHIFQVPSYLGSLVDHISFDDSLTGAEFFVLLREICTNKQVTISRGYNLDVSLAPPDRIYFYLDSSENEIHYYKFQNGYRFVIPDDPEHVTETLLLALCMTLDASSVTIDDPSRLV